jgi:hypothetical protein
MRWAAGAAPNPSGQGGRMISCPWPNTNGPNQTRFESSMRQAARDALKRRIWPSMLLHSFILATTNRLLICPGHRHRATTTWCDLWCGDVSCVALLGTCSAPLLPLIQAICGLIGHLFGSSAHTGWHDMDGDRGTTGWNHERKDKGYKGGKGSPTRSGLVWNVQA